MRLADSSLPPEAAGIRDPKHHVADPAKIGVRPKAKETVHLKRSAFRTAVEEFG